MNRKPGMNTWLLTWTSLVGAAMWVGFYFLWKWAIAWLWGVL